MDTNFKVLIALMGLEIGGAETHVLELCKALKRKGVDLYVVSNGGVYEKELTDYGIKHIHAPLHNKNISNFIKSYKILKKTIIDNNIKLVHSHARIPSFLLGILQKSLSFRFVTTAHLDFKTTFPFNILSNWGEASLAVSEDIKTYLVDNYNVSPDKILLTINGIDMEKFSPKADCSSIKKEFDLKDEVKKIVYISRMDKDRSLVAHQLIEIVPWLYKTYGDMEVIIVGGGNDFKNIEKEANEVNEKLGKRIIILTNQRTDINNFVVCADYFVGVSRSALEAMSCGKPCIISGNQGYIGIFNEDVRKVSIDTNFCCRGLKESTTTLLKSDFEKLFSMTSEDLEKNSKYSMDIIREIYSVDTMADNALELYSLVRKSNRKTDVVVSGYYGFRNDGDDAILKTIINGIRNIKPDAKITILSKRPKETKQIHGVETISRTNLFLIWKKLKESKLLLSGGGTLVQDLTSTQSILYYLTIMNLAKRAGCKGMLYSNGIGPIRVESNRKLANKILNMADVITVRDQESYEELKNLNITKPKIELTVDPVLGYECSENNGVEILKSIGVSENKFFVVSIRNWKFLKSDFTDILAKYCDEVYNLYNLVPIFVPMQRSNDTEISKIVISKMLTKGYFLEKECTTEDMIGIMGKANFVLAMRLHSVIYGIKANVPIIGISYDPKVESMMNAINQKTFLKSENINLEELLKFNKIIEDNREKIIQEISDFEKYGKELTLKNNILVCDLIDAGEF